MAQSKKGLLADLFDGTFTMLPRTWLTGFAAGVVLFIPGALLYGYSFARIFSMLGDLAASAGEPELLLPLAGAYALLGVGTLVQGLAMLFVRACVTEHTARAAAGRDAPLFEVIGHVFLHRFGRLIGQRALQYAILVVTIIAGSVGAGFLVALGAAFEAPLVPILAGVLIGVAAYAVTAWLSIRWSLSLEAVVVEGARVEVSLDRSAQLVKGAWWRVLGYTLLLSLMVSFAVSLIGTPLVFFATIKVYAQFLGSVLSGSSDGEDFLGQMRDLMVGMGPRFAILMYLQSLFSVIVVPVFMTLLFLGLRERTDAPEPSAVLPTPPADPQPLPGDEPAPGSAP